MEAAGGSLLLGEGHSYVARQESQLAVEVHARYEAHVTVLVVLVTFLHPMALPGSLL